MSGSNPGRRSHEGVDSWPAVTGAEPGPDGNLYVFYRCFENSCLGRPEDPIVKFDMDGQPLESWGAGMFMYPHGFHVDFEGNVWATDANGEEGIGHQVFKFSSDGELLMTLGEAGVPGDGPDHFNQPTDVFVAPDGSFFVTDGHGQGNNRVVKFAADGTYLMEWGRPGSGPGEFTTPSTQSSSTPVAWRLRGRSGEQPHPDLHAGRGIPGGVAAVRAPERNLHHAGRQDLRGGFRVLGAQQSGLEEGHPHRQRMGRVRHTLHRGHRIDGRPPQRRRSGRGGCGRERLRWGGAAPNAGEARAARTIARGR